MFGIFFVSAFKSVNKYAENTAPTLTVVLPWLDRCNVTKIASLLVTTLLQNRLPE